MSPPLTTSMTGPETTPSRSLTSSMVPHARSYWARFLDRTRRPSLSSFCRTRASIRSPRLTISWGSTSWRIDSSRAGITPFGLEADVEKDLVVVDFDHGAGNDVAVLELHDGPGDGVLERGAVEIVGHDLARRVLTGLVKGPHLWLGRKTVGAEPGRELRGWWSSCRTSNRRLLSGQKHPPKSRGGREQQTVRRLSMVHLGREQELRVFEVRGPRRRRRPGRTDQSPVTRDRRPRP